MSEAAAPHAPGATLIGFLGTLGWAVYGVLVISADGTPPFLALSIMFVVATVTLLVVRILRRQRMVELLRIPLPTLALGVLGLFGSNMLWVVAVATGANPISVSIIGFSWPVVMVATVLLLGLARATALDLLALVLGFAGMAAVVLEGGRFVFHWGLLLAAGSAVCWGLYSALRRLVPAGPPDSMIAFVAVSAILTIPVHLLSGEARDVQFDDLLALAAVGAFPVGIANVLWDYGTRRGDPVLLGSLAFIEPVISSGLVAVVLGKAFGIEHAVALALIMGGTALSMLSERQRRRAAAGASGLT